MLLKERTRKNQLNLHRMKILEKPLKSAVSVICATFHTSVVIESRPTLLGDSICGGTCWITQGAYLCGPARSLVETPRRPTTSEVCNYRKCTAGRKPTSPALTSMNSSPQRRNAAMERSLVFSTRSSTPS